MLTLFEKKNVEVNVEVANDSELAAIQEFARIAGDKLEIDAQNLKSGFLASAAQDHTVLAGRVAVLHGSSEAVSEPQTVMVSFKQPVAWGSDATQKVDYAVGVVMPSDSTDAQYQAIVQKIAATLKAHAAELPELKAEKGKLNKVRKAFTA